MSEGLESVSYDQYTNIPTMNNSKIILSEKANERLLMMMAYSAKFDKEFGCFFIGIESKQNPNVILVDFIGKPFNNESDAVYYDKEHENELIDKYREYESNGISPHVIHYHVHPKRKHFEGFSDNDYINYAAWTARCSGLKSYGLLATPSLDFNNETGELLENQTTDNPNNNFNLNAIIAENGKDEPKRWYSADFYRCPSICYIKGNEVYEFGGYQKNFKVRKFAPQNDFDFKRKDRIIRNYGNYNNSKVIAIGHDQYGNIIGNESIGYIDVNDTIRIPEDECYDFPSLEKKNNNSKTR